MNRPLTRLDMQLDPTRDLLMYAAIKLYLLVINPYQDTLREVDTFAKNLHDLLAERNLIDIVDVLFVSDHGMTDTSHPELVYMDDILGAEGLKEIAHEDGWPSMGLRFHDNTNVSKYHEALLRASGANPDKFDVYTHETMPKRYHFAHHHRIAPIYVVPKIGYVLTTKEEGDVRTDKGVSKFIFIISLKLT